MELVCLRMLNAMMASALHMPTSMIHGPHPLALRLKPASIRAQLSNKMPREMRSFVVVNDIVLPLF